METCEKEHQIETLWKNYEAWKTYQQIMEKVAVYSIAAREILAYEEYLERERQAEGQLKAAELIWRIRESVSAGNILIASFEGKK